MDSLEGYLFEILRQVNQMHLKIRERQRQRAVCGSTTSPRCVHVTLRSHNAYAKNIQRSARTIVQRYPQ